MNWLQKKLAYDLHSMVNTWLQQHIYRDIEDVFDSYGHTAGSFRLVKILKPYTGHYLNETSNLVLDVYPRISHKNNNILITDIVLRHAWDDQEMPQINQVQVNIDDYQTLSVDVVAEVYNMINHREDNEDGDGGGGGGGPNDNLFPEWPYDESDYTQEESNEEMSRILAPRIRGNRYFE